MDVRTKTRRTVAFFSMPEEGHFQRLLPLIAGLARLGFTSCVFTHSKFKPQVERAGGLFFDLFSRYPLERADDESLPVPCRFVTFAGKYAGQILRDVEKIAPSLLIHDTFAVIGRVVATQMGLPRVNVCAGHNVAPARYLAALREDPRVKISAKCLEAVGVLQESFGLADASPFSYVSSLSPDLNIYCEPPEFLEEEKRRAFEPLAFYGSLLPPEEEKNRRKRAKPWFRQAAASKLKVYVSFGTIVWRYYAADALRALTTLTEAFAAIDHLCAVVSLGGASIDSRTRASLSRSNVSVHSRVDQQEVLKEADVFVTHHGMNSTHEAIFYRVPMISYPFFWDQPELAEICQNYGLAVPLADSPRGEFSQDRVRAVLARLTEKRPSMQAAISRARDWELAVIRNRPAVHQRIVSLIP